MTTNATAGPLVSGRPGTENLPLEQTVNHTDPFVPPAAEGLPAGTLEAAEIGASALDAWARTPHGRNFLAHALVQLARTGWLRTEPGEGFEPVQDQETPEPLPAAVSAVVSPPTSRAELRKAVARAIHRYDNHHALSGNDVPSEHHYGEADAVLAVLPEPTSRAAVLREAEAKAREIVAKLWGDGTTQEQLDRAGGARAVEWEIGLMASGINEPAPDFFQPGHSYTHRNGSTFRCVAVTTHPDSGERVALGWHTDTAGWTFIDVRNINHWNHEYDGVEPPSDGQHRVAAEAQPSAAPPA